MTRLALPAEDFVLWAERLADLDWPISGEDFPAVVVKLGWGPGNFSNQLRTLGLVNSLILLFSVVIFKDL